MKTLTKVQVINHVVKHFSKHPRAVIGGNCRMVLPDGRLCAVSICLNEQVDRKKLDKDGKGIWGQLVNNIVTLKDFKPEFQIDDPIFWDNIQKLHDTHLYWRGTELTPEGKARVKELKEKYK
jgi:hypothetical protein